MISQHTDTLTSVWIEAELEIDKTYTMVYLENEYVKIGILPEIGGKVFEAIDKTNHYDFIYHQHVIKPALISLLGAWISGGIEWDLPTSRRWAARRLVKMWKRGGVAAFKPLAG